MFELIAYIFNIIIALGVGFIIGYNYKKDQRRMQIQLNTTILSFLVTSLFGILVLSVNFDISFVSFIFIAIVYLVTKQYNDFDIIDKNRLIFAGINGIIIGLGYVFYSILITLFLGIGYTLFEGAKGRQWTGLAMLTIFPLFTYPSNKIDTAGPIAKENNIF